MAIETIIFDAYGTLFDVNAAARQAASGDDFPELADAWQHLSADWRTKQLEYTWLRAITGEHADFWQVTQDGLDWAMERAGLSGDSLRERLLQLYWDLAAFDEVPEMLKALKAADLCTGILSNGSPEMLSAAVKSAGIARHLDHTLSVETVGVFKPARAVYDLVGRTFDCDPAQVAFVSSNGWDAAGAASYGFVSVWVNRLGLPMDRLPGTPAHVLPDLVGLPDLIEGL
ncbi:haloacid dehalogenase type II [Jannaschia sp. LMIT008]|uniref:haloacid dehalogenase type II n=1 Tax=Jannaschia maritima TaxID=3032585 RepID=UPI002810DC37|nr:haloacid dehalogenase type II [Jannaschia sp. LMIT008]